MDLLLSSPLWIVVIVLTVAIHVGFFFVVRRLIKIDERSAANRKEQGQQGPDGDER